MGIVDEILSDRGGALAGVLVEKAGFSNAEARQFLPGGIGKLCEALGGGGVDVGALLGGGGFSSVVSKVDAGSLAATSGIEVSKAASGLQALLPPLLSALQDKAGGAAGILSLLGGGSAERALGSVGNLAGKFFNR